MHTLLILLAAGFVAGVMNALAGGGSFVGLPALIAVGTPAVVANATNTVAMLPGGFVSIWTYRKGPRGLPGLSLKRLLAITLIGGLAGSLLLLFTPEKAFEQALPWLLLLATVTLAFGRPIAAALHGRRLRARVAILVAGQFAIGVYGGYFGGAAGIMLLAFWTVVAGVEVKDAHLPRTALITSANAIAALVFIVMGAVDWRALAAMVPGSLLGGWLGALLGRRLRPEPVRLVTIAIAVVITALFFVKTYG